MPMINATIEAQAILGVPAIVASSDSRLINPEGVVVYFLDAYGNVCNHWSNPATPVSVHAQIVWNHARPHWGSVNGGGIGHAII
jgi:hypothetical protein